VTEARLIRRVRFRASHRYGRPDLSPEENQAAYGAQAETHPHDWMVEAQVAGPIDPATGFVTDLAALDGALELLVGDWRDGDLNESIPQLRTGEMQPSTEALARWIFGRLARSVAAPARLVRVRVFESADLGAAFPA
jgi:6-pyruvoyltetrahydropterin/6-carboxytetrahydropterin synthase